MNKLTKILLGGAALSALAITTAMAQQKHSPFSFTALHAGRAVNKTKQYHCRGLNQTSCILSATSSVPASDLHKTVPLAQTFYKLNSNGDLCTRPKQKIRSWKKSTYAKISTGTETYSEGCSSGPTTFYGDFYKLADKSGFGKTDRFESMLSGRVKYGGETYKVNLILDVAVPIGTE